MYLCVGAVLPLALATGEQIGLSASGSCHLMVPDSLFGQVLPHFLQLITGHFLEREREKKKSKKYKLTVTAATRERAVESSSANMVVQIKHCCRNCVSIAAS